ncbi:MAG: hypothetical protein L0Z73_10545 [Gammaproteobacteria bacterium]|nr:hypothetical protein [Gammaproteobacteria bacterium]
MAKIIVIGYVESVIKAPVEGSTAVIRVEKVIKGKTNNRIAVRTIECEFLWEEGRRYKLFLLQDDMGFYHTRRCLGNKEYL